MTYFSGHMHFNALIYCWWIIGICLHSFTNNERSIFNTVLGGLVQYFSFKLSELVQVNPDNSLAEYVNLE